MATPDVTRQRGVPRLRLIEGGQAAATRDFVSGRAAAAAAMVAGYERALEALDPDDVAERLWYADRLHDARTIASTPECDGASPVDGGDDVMAWAMLCKACADALELALSPSCREVVRRCAAASLHAGVVSATGRDW